MGNTRALHRGLETEIARIDRYGQTMPAAFSVLILDLDRLMEINDTFGHLTGHAGPEIKRAAPRGGPPFVVAYDAAI